MTFTRAFAIGDKVRITEEFTCEVDVLTAPGRTSTTIRVGDTGVLVSNHDDKFQVRMETGDYAGYITDVFGIELVHRAHHVIH